MPGVFINYRRDDAKADAGRLSDRLSAHFGRDRVFMDVAGSIAPGQEFDQVIEKAVSSSNALVVVIGKQWLTLADAGGRRRLDDTDDYVRKEISSALDKGKTVIPVLVQGATMPTAEQLPDDLDRLSKKQALEISDSRWDYDSGQLIKALESAGVEPVVREPEKPDAHEQAATPQTGAALKINWKAIVSLVMGIFLLASFAEANFDQDEKVGGLIVSLVALGLAISAFYDAKLNKVKWRGLAIADMVIGGVLLLAFIGQLTTNEQSGTPVVTTPPLPASPNPAPPVPAVPEEPAPQPRVSRSVNITGQWRGPDGMYIFQQSGSNVIFQLYGWNQVLIAQGTGAIQGATVKISFVRIDNTGGEATLEVASHGRQMAGVYMNLVTGENGSVVLVR